MRIILLIAFLWNVTSVKSQTFSGRVFTEKGEPIPFVSIGVKEKDVGTYSFLDGSYTVNLRGVSSEDTLIFSTIGYQKASFRIDEIPELVNLREDIRELDEVTINPSQTQFFGIQKKKSSSDISISRPYNGAEVALLVELPHDSLWIGGISLNVRTSNIDAYKIRVKLYRVHSATEKPGELIESISLFSQDSIAEGTIHFVPTSSIPIAGPIFISFEWLVTKSEAGLIKKFRDQPLPIMSKLRKEFPENPITIYNQSRIEIENQQGKMIKRIRLDKASKKALATRAEELPVLKFQTTKSNLATYYRTHSHGRWSRYHQSLVAGVHCSRN